MLSPLRYLVVRQEVAGEVISPAYDALSPQERATVAAARPRSWLNVTASPSRPGQHGDDPKLLASNRGALVALLAEDAFDQVGPALFLYRLTTADHQQTAVVGELPLDAVRSGMLLGHESIQPERVATLAANLASVAATSSPVAATWRGGPDVRTRVAQLTAGPPLLDVTVPGDVRQQVWAVTDPAAIVVLSEAITSPLFIIDGHHRTAAALAYRDRHPARSEFDDRLLVAAFPASELRLAPFHRLVRANGHRPAPLELLPGLDGPSQAAEPAPRQAAVVDTQGRWWRLPLRERPADEGGELDVTILHRSVLEPVLGVWPGDPRLVYVPGHFGPAELARRTASEGGVGFALGPPELSTVLDHAERGLPLPPKTTFFHPKVRSGVFVRLHDPADAALQL